MQRWILKDRWMKAKMKGAIVRHIRLVVKRLEVWFTVELLLWNNLQQTGPMLMPFLPSIQGGHALQLGAGVVERAMAASLTTDTWWVKVTMVLELYICLTENLNYLRKIKPLLISTVQHFQFMYPHYIISNSVSV